MSRPDTHARAWYCYLYYSHYYDGHELVPAKTPNSMDGKYASESYTWRAAFIRLECEEDKVATVQEVQRKET